MRNFLKQVLVFTILFIPLSTSLTFAQGDVSELVRSAPGDAAKLSQAYLNPLFKGIGFGLNSGWHNTAKAKNLGRVDVRFVGTIAFVPQENRSFDIRALNLSSNTRLRNPNDFIAPTAFGKKSSGPELVLFDDAGREVGSLNTPQGTGINIVPTPQLQVTVGLIKNTDVSLRYAPKIKISDKYGSISQFGFGFKHEISPYLFKGIANTLIPIDIALAVNYNQLNYDLAFDGDRQINPENNAQPKDNAQSTNFSNQRIDGKFTGFGADLIVSKKLLFFTGFGTFGYNTAKTDVALLGNYPVNTGYNILLQPTYTTFSDPVKLQGNATKGFRSTLGFQMAFGFFRFYSAYNFGDYQAFTGGIGIGIGK